MLPAWILESIDDVKITNGAHYHDVIGTSYFGINGDADYDDGFNYVDAWQNDNSNPTLQMEYLDVLDENDTSIHHFVPAQDASGNYIIFDTITMTGTYMHNRDGNETNPVLGNVVTQYIDYTDASTADPSTHDYYIDASSARSIGAVRIKAVTSSIDENIQEENIKSGVSILGVNGTYNPSITLQRAEYISNENDRSVYINTGIAPDNETVLEITMATKKTWWGSWGGWAGVISGEYHLALFQYNNDRQLDGLYGPNGGSWLYGPAAGGTNNDTWSYPHTYRIGGSTSEFTDSSTITTDHTFYYVYDQELYGTGNVINSQWTGDQRLFVFGVSNGEQGAVISQYAPTPMRVYRVRIIKGQEIVYDAFPYYNVATGNYCLMDNISGNVSEQFGTFSGKLMDNPVTFYEPWVQNCGLLGSNGQSTDLYKSRGNLRYQVQIGAPARSSSNLYFRCKFEISYVTYDSTVQQVICTYGDISTSSSAGFLFAIGTQGNALCLWSTADGYTLVSPITLSYILPGVHTIEILPTNGGQAYYPVYVDGVFKYTFNPTTSYAANSEGYMSWFGGRSSSFSYKTYNGCRIYWIEAIGYDEEIHKFMPIKYQGVGTFYDCQNKVMLNPIEGADGVQACRDNIIYQLIEKLPRNEEEHWKREL